ncbi:Mu transposase C-terminal domain-containing protein [Paralcaligenes sp. KSB-10]|uniref:Mu transposase C-terminal domain-containing protein n=1 Tax=Paralcaligenes sp. KSB-10 TaxID=2901142 RepID=UPI001E4FA261|nr:Mu transposase C-terminal domain-containing protein [Paralcaligenes sp. KSB-10]UHL63505.1 Mu transposase C-terminal domain-containing protein [Paralcaligenes sp. KSB-10]
MYDLTELKAGHVFEGRDQKFFVADINRAINQIVLQNTKTGERTYVELNHLYGQVRKGELTYSGFNGHSPEAHVRLLSDAVLSEHSKAEYRYRLQVVTEVERLLGCGHDAAEAYAMSAQAIPVPEALRGKVFSARTVRRWYSAYCKGSEKALAPAHARKGRTRAEYSTAHDELIRKVIYDNSEKSRLTIKDLCTKANLRLSHKPNAQPGEHIGYHQVRRLLLETPWVIRHANKFEPKLRRAIVSFGVESYIVEQPFERVEMDYAKLPILPILSESNRTEVEAWAALAIDIATGHLLAAEVFTAPPNGMDALQTVQRACYGLDDAQFERAGIQNRMQVCGAITEVVVDNGSEFRNASFTQLADLGVKVTFAPSYSPYRKPFVERAVGALKAFVGSLPGSTVNRASPGEPDLKQASRDACITVDQLRDFVNAFIFDDYALRELSRHELTTCLLGETSGLTPAQRMQTKLQQFTPAPPIAEESFRLARMVRYERTLQKYGIEFETLHYSSPELRLLHQQIGISTQSLVVPDKLTIFVDPLDVRTIHVVHPLTKHRFPADLKYSLPHAMTFAHFKEARDFARAEFKSETSAAIVRAFRIRVMGVVEDLERKAKAVSRRDKKAKRVSTTFISQAKTSAKQPALKETELMATPQLEHAQPAPGELDMTKLKSVRRIGRPAK